jgi:hypothetical protein
MMGFKRGIGLAVAVSALWLAGPAGAQESLDSGKSGAQLFASDCAICHKTPGSIKRPGGQYGLANFLTQHYTASVQSANAIAAYVNAAGGGQAPAGRSATGKRTAKGDDKAKAGDTKPGTPKSGEVKTGKPAGAKTSAPKTAEPKASESKPAEPKPAEPKPAEAKASGPQPAAPIPDKPAKSD